MKVYTTERIPIKIWLNDPEEGAISQAKNLANLPFAFHHIALMPDTHEGYGMPIGGVMATRNVIVPNAVGVDIGCGMCAVKTDIKDIDELTLKNIMSKIREVVPLGFNHHKSKQDDTLMPQKQYGQIVKREYEKALYQIGTLGGGNHFIEIQKGDDGFVYIMIHSGSRNLGLKIAEFYNKKAVDLNKKYFSAVDIKQDLAFLPLEDAEDYINEMNFAVDFAFANRKLMMMNIIDVVKSELKSNFGEIINIAHNYAKIENHFGSNVWIHRKGATLATVNTIGFIPGSMGTSSYIVKGKGNKDSFTSCSHGAGRKMSRIKAIKELVLKDEISKLDDKGIIHSIRTQKQLDEAPSAYKDIDVVMENQKDLVDVLVKLKPIAVIKG